MLKQRILTALVLAPLAIGGIFLLPQRPFEIFIGAILFLGAWEWANLSGLTGALQRWAYAGVLSGILMLLGWIGPVIYPQVLVAGALFWLVAFIWVRSYPDSQRFWASRALRCVLGVLVLVPAWVALAVLKSHPQSGAMILYLMLIVWGADIGAYFAGRAWGQSKLAPNVSPGKTWAGFYGGLGSVCGIAVAGGFYWQLELSVWGVLTLVTLVAALASVLGDLFESMLKRYRGIKDSSQLLPGHGGVMDRIDSLTAAAPLFALGTYLMGGSLY